MALNAYLYLRGQKQGDIKGSVTQKGLEGSIEVHAFNHLVSSPRDPSSGLATGKRMHNPLTLLKHNDKSSPLLWNVLVNNENLTSFVLKFYSPDITGIEKQTYSITLTNAQISSIREFMLDNEDPLNQKFPVREEISFTYQKIQWTWTDGMITAQDDWQMPVV